MITSANKLGWGWGVVLALAVSKWVLVGKIIAILKKDKTDKT